MGEGNPIRELNEEINRISNELEATMERIERLKQASKTVQEKADDRANEIIEVNERAESAEELADRLLKDVDVS